VNANSPRRPAPAGAPGHDVTSAVMRWLAVRLSVVAVIQDLLESKSGIIEGRHYKFK
jgi:hypothetical protein